MSERSGSRTTPHFAVSKQLLRFRISRFLDAGMVVLLACTAGTDPEFLHAF